MKAVLITTEFRGVFFGYLASNADKSPDKITLKNARNCIYWSSDCGGFLGLVADGPTVNCRIGSKVPEITLYKVTRVSPVTDKAVQRWENIKCKT